MEIQALRPEDAAASARLHYQGQQDTFLGQMGVPFLTALYRELASSPWGFGVVAVEDGEVVGVATAAWDTGHLFRDLILHRWQGLLGPALGAVVRRPSLLLKALETLTYPWKLGTAGRGSVELLFLGVDEARRGHGIGGKLIEARVEECRRRGYAAVHCLVDVENDISTQMHLRRGFQAEKAITLYGRKMVIYKLVLRERGGERMEAERHPNLRIEPLRPEHALASALMHHEGQLHTFLGQMGVPFLTALYRELATSPWGFGLVAVDEAGEVVGVVTATRSTPNLFRDLILRRGWRLLGPTLRALLRRPAFVLYALETLTYPWKVGHVERGEFEFLFIGMRRDWQGRGFGSRLMDELIAECRRRGCRALDSLVEEANPISNRMHLQRGFRVKKKIVLYGRPMTLYTLDLEKAEGAGP
jgi:ribosomal protein S18 acetylase RimI-like enzyme